MRARHSTRVSTTLRTACLGLAVAAAVAGCSGSSSAGGAAGATSSAASSASTSATPPASLSATATSTAQAVATALDPCQLVTRSEASTLAGASFGPGKEEPNGAGKRCVYGAATPNVFTVEVVQATDAATAQAVWSQAQAEAQSAVKQQVPPGIHLALATDGVDIGDKAATVSGGASIAGHSFGFSGVYVLKGATFFAFQDLLLTKAPPTLASMEDQARTTLTRVS